MKLGGNLAKYVLMGKHQEHFGIGMLLLYDIKPEIDPHGARIRLVRLLKKSNAIPLQRSTWLIQDLTPELLKLIDEIRALGGTVLISEWKPAPMSRFREGGFRKLDSSHVVGVVIHGPEIVDMGWAEKIFDFLKGTGARVIAKIGGTMGRTAIIDAKLDDRIDIKSPMRPSQVIDEFERENVDLIILLNHGKSIETGISLGMEVLEHARLIQLLKVPLIQIERPGEPDGAIIPWTGNADDLVRWLASELELGILQPPIITKRVEVREGKIYRTLLGVHPGEKILVNGFVVGESFSTDVTLVAEAGRIIDVIGGQLDRHGTKKIGEVDLTSATVKTLRVLRRTYPKEKASRRIAPRRGVALVEKAENALDIAQRAKLVVSIGDDTTLIAGEILSRFGIPLIGIVDGDADGLLMQIAERAPAAEIVRSASPRSTIIRVKPGSDDEVGKLVKEKIFHGEEIVKFRKVDIRNLKAQIIRLLGDLVLEVVAA